MFEIFDDVFVKAHVFGPSARDDGSMRQIVEDPKVGANFAVLLIVKLGEKGELIATAHTYLPDGSKHRSNVSFGESGVHNSSQGRSEAEPEGSP